MQEQISLQDIQTTKGLDLVELSMHRPILLLFLRHFGCVFCREALVEVSEKHEEWLNKGYEVVLVHMSEPAFAEEYFERFKIPTIKHISDPTMSLYKRFELGKGKLSQLVGLRTMIRGFKIMADKNVYPTPYFIGDGYQMPGAFVISKGKITNEFVHKNAYDRPDYDALLNSTAD